MWCKKKQVPAARAQTKISCSLFNKLA